MITMSSSSSSVNARDYAAAYRSSSYEAADSSLSAQDDDLEQRNYAWPTASREQRKRRQHHLSQPTVQSESARHYEEDSRSSPHPHHPPQSSLPSIPSASQQAYPTNGNSAHSPTYVSHTLSPSTSQPSNLRMNADANRAVGPSHFRQDIPPYAQQSSPRTPSSSTLQHVPGGLAHSRQTSQATTLGPSGYQRSSPTDISPTPMRPPLRSRVFGLTKDMRPQTDLVDPAFFPGGVVPPEAATLAGAETSKDQPAFSVELLAPSFDNRGYPVYGGKAAIINGYVRMPKREQSDVIVKISAHTTSGAAAAVWDGVALQPVESGSERTVFTICDTFSATEGKVEQIAVSSAATSTQSTNSADASIDDQGVLAIPFALNLPVGGSTRVVDGQVETVAVALPPSFEMSSEQDSREKAILRNTGNAGPLASGAASVKTSKTKMTAITLRDAVESGLQQVYRVGCFYRVTFTLAKPKGSDKDRKGSGLFGKKVKSRKQKGSEHLSIPFVFMGEMTSLPPLPTSLPPIPPTILREPSCPLAAGWISERASAKWSGMLFRNMRRTVDLQLFLPGTNIHAPSVVPILLIIRPEDPDMLPQPSTAASSGGMSISHPGSPRPGVFRHDPNDGNPASMDLGRERPSLSVPRHIGLSPAGSPVSSPGVGDHSNRQLGSHLESQEEGQEEEVMRSSDEHASVGNALSRILRTSLSLSRNSGNKHGSQSASQSSPTEVPPRELPPGKQAKRQTSRSTFGFNRRPNTAPSRSSSDSSPMGTEASFTVRGGGGGASSSGGSGGVADLPGLVRVSLLQSVYYSSSNVNDPPKCKRRLVSVADLEEVDLDRVADGREPGFQSTQDTIGSLAESKAKGVRVLRGLLRVGREATPSFRVQSIELKYAIKVDLLPFNSKAKGPGRSKTSPTSPPRTPPSRPSMHSTLGGVQNLTTTTSGTGASGTGPGSGAGAGSGAVGGSSAVRHHPASSSTAPNSANWSPPQPASSRQSLRGGMSYQASVAGGLSEAGWTKRSPSDQTVMANEGGKVHKSVGALWVNVRMVKGRGSL